MAKIKQAVALGSTVRTDDGKGYGGLPALGYQRRVMRAEASVGGNLLPLANRVASAAETLVEGDAAGGGSSDALGLRLG